MPSNDKIINELFGSKTKARILKLFLHNPHLILSFKEIGVRTGSKKTELKKALAELKKNNIITNGKNKKDKK